MSEHKQPIGLCLACNEAVPDFAFRKESYSLYQCPFCGFLFVHPFPGDDQINKFYNDNYQHASAEVYPKAGSRARRALGKSLLLLPYVFGKSVLDIGCGGGFMVNAFARVGARASGLDINALAIAYARRHFPRCEFYCESLCDFRSRGLRYDFVFSTEVFEHLAGPTEFMATLDAITQTGSRVYIATPDLGHTSVPNDLSQWSEVAPPAHLQFCDRRGLSILFRRFGFTLEKAYHKRSWAHALIFRREGPSPLNS